MTRARIPACSPGLPISPGAISGGGERRPNLPVNIASRAALFAEVSTRLKARQGFALATLNLDHLVKISTSDRFRQAYDQQDLVVADGNPIVWLSRLAGRQVELLPGSDLVKPLAALAAELGVKLALVGSTADTLAIAARTLEREVPGLVVTCQIAPKFGFDPTGAEADAVLSQLNASGAGLAFLALGAPKQEILATHARDLAPNIGFASIGAGLDFLSGSQKRAPSWVRALAMEWLWRALSSPRRLLPRYVRCAVILPGYVGQAIKHRRHPA